MFTQNSQGTTHIQQIQTIFILAKKAEKLNDNSQLLSRSVE